jgi:riboflavin synthase
MFTGIVTDVGEVVSVTPRAANLHRLRIACSYPDGTIAHGASIACAGICLTATNAGIADGKTWFEADAAAETLAITTAGSWRAGTKINLERPLKAGDELGGHIVSGHVDGVAELTARRDMPEMAALTFRPPPALLRFIAAKGSVALDGVSLTVNEAGTDAFTVLIIPHTLKVTTFGARKAGDRVNLEIDTMARYAARLAEFR